MQRDRLEGWMVRQIEQADLARGTVIQLPSRASTAPPKPSAVRSPSASKGLGSPRRGCGISGLAVVQRPETQADSHQPQRRPPVSPAERMRQRLAPPNSSLHFGNASIGELDEEDSVARQWRLHFQDPNRPFKEDGKVDRTQVLKSPRRQEVVDHAVDDELADQEEWENAIDDLSPLASWGVSREYILEFIRQSVMPAAWTTHARFSGEWEAVPPAEPDGRYAARDTDEDGASPFLTSLPPLSARSKPPHSPDRSPTRQTGSPRRSTSPTRSLRRPHPGALVPAVTSPRLKPPRYEERIQRVLTELRADPKAWEAFQKEVKRYLDDQRRRQHESNKIRENKQRASISPRAPVILAERKRRRDERVERTQRHRQLLIRDEDARLEAMVLAYRRRTQATNQSESDAPRDITTTVPYRRRKMWLVAVSFALATTALQQRLLRARQRQVLERMQTRAARAIQRLWKKFKWRHASKQTIVIYTWLRKCLWKLMFKMRCRRKRRLATVLQRFMLDHFSGSRETRNFNRMMLKWRGKVIVSQRLGLGFVQCSRARLAALAIWWDALDHERQRSERQGHDRHLPLADEKEAEWNALVGSTRGRLLIRRPSTMGASSRSLSISPAAPSPSSPSSPSPTTVSATGGLLHASGGGTPMMLSRRSVSTRQLLDQMDERLTTMQQVLTPIEIQRLQQHAFHVVKIPKAIKLRLLQELLAAARKDYIRKLSLYQEQAACSSYTREVRLDDARAIVQGSGTWGSLLIDTKTGKPKLQKPVFQLFSGGDRRRTIEELVRRGVQLTLESDPEQRALVERQRQQRMALEAGATPLGSGSAANGAVSNAPSSARKRESNAPTGSLMPQPPMGSNSMVAGVGDGGGRRRSTRKLTFAVPATIREKPKRG